MYNGAEKRNGKGLRCSICTGCGLCAGVSGRERSEGLHVLTEDALYGENLPLNGGNRRLVAADIGTTTVAMLLYREDGTVEDRYVAVNPQTVYGADVLSRIRAAETAACAADMCGMVREILRRGLERFQRKLSAGERLFMMLAANTTMTYLLRGLDPAELGRAPFFARHLEPAELVIADVPCFVFSGFSAFVGGDIAAGAYACGMAERDELTLLVDLGTNGEMMLGGRKGRIACATAAGPAFEGGASRGVWGADMVSLLALLRREGILDETGLLAEAYFEKGIRAGNVLVTQEAVRGIQLAKAAVTAGIEVLLRRYGAGAAQVERVVLAGGFGYYLKPADAAEIGLLPETLAGKAVAGGNTALSGCLKGGRLLFSEGEEALRGRLKELTEGTGIVNLAEEPEFNEIYINSMKLAKTEY